jgi:hypothetical protein
MLVMGAVKGAQVAPATTQMALNQAVAVELVATLGTEAMAQVSCNLVPMVQGEPVLVAMAAVEITSLAEAAEAWEF